jgi:CheY-like chemotaxis protein
MSIRCPLSLVGLTSTDRSLLETLFAQSWRYGPGYEVVADLSRAEMVIANADDPDVLRNLRAARLNIPVLLIGATDGGTGWVRLPRPIHLPAVIDAMTHLDPRLNGVQLRAVAPPKEENSLFASLADFTAGNGIRQPIKAPPAPARPSAPAAMPTAPVLPPVSPIKTKGPAISFPPPKPPDHANDFAMTVAFSASMMPGFTDSGESQSGFTATQQFEHSRAPYQTSPAADAQDRSILMWHDDVNATAKGQPPALNRRFGTAEQGGESVAEMWSMPADLPELTSPLSVTITILLVGSSHLADGSLMRALLRLGYQVDCAQDVDEVLGRLEQHQHRFVFLDASSLGKRTNEVCRAVRKWGRNAKRPPHVVVVDYQDGLLRRWLAKLAGCDGWMMMPFRRRDLQSYLEKRLNP